MSDIKVVESDYGDEIWFGGKGRGIITVGEWICGGQKHHPEEWEKRRFEARLIYTMLRANERVGQEKMLQFLAMMEGI